MPRLYNQRTDGFVLGAIPIDRDTPFGNPYVIGRDGDRDQVCDKFNVHLARNPDLIARVRRELRGKDLICWCRHCAVTDVC
jgi:hypothetical protein